MTPHRLRLSARLLLAASIATLGAAGLATGAPDDAAPRPMTLPDVLSWKSIRAAEVSANGSWLGYTLAPTEGDAEVVVRSVYHDDVEYRFPAGDLGLFGSAQQGFSADGGWYAYLRKASADEAAKARKARKPLHDDLVVVDLSDGSTEEFAGVRAFAFSGAGRLAIHRVAPEGNGGSGNGNGDGPKGSDLLLRDLADDSTLTIGSAGEFAFDEDGRYLAVAIDTADRAGNGLQLHDLESGRVRALDSDRAVYSRLVWAERGDALAALRSREADGWEQELVSVVAFAGIGTDAMRKVVFDPATVEGFPEGMTVNSETDAEWNDARDALVFTIREVDAKPAEDEAAADDGLDTSDLVIWHWRDPRLQSRQQVQERGDRSFGFLSAYRVDEERFVRLADEQVRDAVPAEGHRWALGFDDDPYERMGNLDGRRYTDVYVIDMQTGDRRKALEQVRWTFGVSPAGDRLLYFEEGNFHTLDFATGESTNLTGGLPVPFWDEEDDHNVVMPPRFQFGLGWSEDGTELLLSDGWDLWRIAADGSAADNVTLDGRERQIRYQRPYALDPDADGIDLNEPVYLTVYGEWTKKGGIGRLGPGTTGVDMLRWDDAVYGRMMKAQEADVWLYTRETQAESPDWYVAGADLADGRRITDTNAQQAGIAWSPGVRLVDYTSAKGTKLQGALYLPANYEPGRSYPTIVYIYERLSQNANRYFTPSANGFNKSYYTSMGYAVLMPDIAYEVNDPGMSAVWSVLPALDAAIETGIVDPEAVGLHGHSWGGYQTSFLVTQTDRFAAAIAGAPLTNMISMYSLIYKNSGGGNGAIFESSQGRFTAGPWEIPEAYVRNSPVYHARAVETPLVILHNDQDGAVDFTQGIEYYNTLRRMEKPVVLLEYVGENHGLRDPANRKDYTVRMLEFFDHYLRDLGMPAWLREGVPYLDLEKHREERARAIAEQVKAAADQKAGDGSDEEGAADEGAGEQEAGASR